MSSSCTPAAVVIAILLLAPAGTAAQEAATEQPAAESTPRTPWGDPDLGGVWDFRTITPLERPEAYGDRAFLTEEEAVTLEQGAAQQDQEANEAPAERTETGGSVGAYNRFWFDFGTSVVADRRTSLIVDPPNGRRPPLTPAGEQRRAFGGLFGFGGSFGDGPFEQVEDLNYFDRCLGTAALPIYPTAYNNNVQVFQTPDHVALLVEMLGSTRIIPIDDRPHGSLRQWLGDSRGRWEGDTLVVETTRFDRDLLFIGGSRDAERLVERFTRVGPGILQYEFTVEDPTVWTQPWTAVQTFRKTEAPLFEYACHEGNYAATNILAGARKAEAAEAAK